MQLEVPALFFKRLDICQLAAFDVLEAEVLPIQRFDLGPPFLIHPPHFLPHPSYLILHLDALIGGVVVFLGH